MKRLVYTLFSQCSSSSACMYKISDMLYHSMSHQFSSIHNGLRLNRPVCLRGCACITCCVQRVYVVLVYDLHRCTMWGYRSFGWFIFAAVARHVMEPVCF